MCLEEDCVRLNTQSKEAWQLGLGVLSFLFSPTENNDIFCLGLIRHNNDSNNLTSLVKPRAMLL